jgi:uncharacterized protein (TIGR02145 family)
MRQYEFAFLFTTIVSFLFAPITQADTVTDIDGNIYQTVTIGTQVWTASNLKVIHYNNGDSIPFVIATENTWTGLTSGASCAYDNNPSNIATYGLMYNWYATVDTRNLAPAGWHVPSDVEWKELELFLGMPQDRVDGTGYRGGSPIGAKLKEVGSVHWNCSNPGATNEYGYTAIPGGCMDNRPVFTELGNYAFFWASSEFSDGSTAAWARDLPCTLPYVGRGGYAKDYGGSVRCIRDTPAHADGGNSNLPDEFRLIQNYPNPFNAQTIIRYTLPVASNVSIDIFDITGRKIETLLSEKQQVGAHSIIWNAKDRASGVYFYRIEAGEYSKAEKCILLK